MARVFADCSERRHEVTLHVDRVGRDAAVGERRMMQEHERARNRSVRVPLLEQPPVPGELLSPRRGRQPAQVRIEKYEAQTPVGGGVPVPLAQVREAPEVVRERGPARKPVFVVAQDRVGGNPGGLQRRAQAVELVPGRRGRAAEDEIAEKGDEIGILLGDLAEDRPALTRIRLSPHLQTRGRLEIAHDRKGSATHLQALGFDPLHRAGVAPARVGDHARPLRSPARGTFLEPLARMNTNPPSPPPPVNEPPAAPEPVIDEPGRQIPAIDPRLPGQPRTIREPGEDPENPRGPGVARPEGAPLTS